MMKEKIYEKVVEWKDYKYGWVDMFLIILFMSICDFITPEIIINNLLAISVYGLINRLKHFLEDRKVYWREIK